MSESQALSKGEMALAALRRAALKAQIPTVITDTDLAMLTERLEGAGLLATVRPAMDADWLPVFESDPNLALALVRAHLERRVRRLVQGSPPKDFEEAMRNLGDQEILSGAQTKALTELVKYLNAAVHGAKVWPEGSRWAQEAGMSILA